MLGVSRAGLEKADLPPSAVADLTRLAECPPSLAALAPFLRSLAAGKASNVPHGPLAELGEGLAQLLAAVGEARN